MLSGIKSQKPLVIWKEDKEKQTKKYEPVSERQSQAKYKSNLSSKIWWFLWLYLKNGEKKPSFYFYYYKFYTLCLKQCRFTVLHWQNQAKQTG